MEKNVSPPVLRPANARFLKRLHQLGPGVSPWPRYQRLNFSSDSQWLVSVEEGKQLRWWKLSERDGFPMVSVPLRAVSAAVALPGEGRVISGTYGGTVQE
jgi:hypothetical protein